MIDLHSLNYLYSLSGLLVGMLVGFTGVGGGALMTPLLVLLFGIAPATAVGTDLLYAAVTKSAGTLVHGRNSTVDWTITRRLATGSIPATIATIAVMYVLGVHGHDSNNIITTLLGIGLILTAATLIFRRSLRHYFSQFSDRLTDSQSRSLTIVLGAFLGVLVSISSVGAGAIGVTVLLVLYPKLPTVRIVGSDIAHAVPLTFIAGCGHWFLGTIDWTLLASLLLGSLPGIVIGSHLAVHVPEKILRTVLAGTLVLVGSRLVI
jgi:LPXTG-motif cell wall-anchored protein